LILSPLSLPFRLLRCRPDLSLIQSIALWNLLGALSEDVLYRRLKRERERERERERWLTLPVAAGVLIVAATAEAIHTLATEWGLLIEDKVRCRGDAQIVRARC
jgi:hypothetical protein